MSYHFYSADHRGLPLLGVRELTWDEEGWPVVASEVAHVGTIVEDE